MFYTHKAYLNAKGGPAVMLLTHDVKRCINDSKAKSGQVTIISTSGTTAVCLLEMTRPCKMNTSNTCVPNLMPARLNRQRDDRTPVLINFI